MSTDTLRLYIERFRGDEPTGEEQLIAHIARSIYATMCNHSRLTDWGMTSQSYAALKAETMTNLRNILLPLIKED